MNKNMFNRTKIDKISPFAHKIVLVQMNKNICSIELKSKISPFAAHKIELVQMNMFSANEQKYVQSN